MNLPEAWIGRAAERWVLAAARAPRRVIAVFLVAGLAAAFLSARGLHLDTDEDALFSAETPYAPRRAAFEAAFPGLVDPIIVLIEGRDAAAVGQAARALRASLLTEPGHFLAVQDPQARDFFARHGLLYLETDALQTAVDRLIEAQPLLGSYAQDPSLRGIAGLLRRGLESDVPPPGFGAALDALAGSLEALHAGRRRPPDWDAQLGLPAAAGPAQRYLLVRPAVDHGLIEPAGAALDTLDRILAEHGLDGHAPVRARVTGLYPLSSEEAHLLSHQVRRAGLYSLLLVACVLLVGLRSLRWVASLILTLLVGLALSAAGATVAVGRLNLITVAFAVLFIGLSVDFGIHLLVRYRELLRGGSAPGDALALAARTTGGALVICAATTACGFFAFIPTDFTGVSELGLICGVSMFIGLATNLTLLPALLRLADLRHAVIPAPPPAPPRWSALPARHRRPVLIAALALSAAAAAALPAVRFDHNPLRLRDPATESVQAFDALLRAGMAFPWNLNVLAASEDDARATAARLEALPSVARVLTLDALVPSEQERKLALIEHLELFLGPALDAPPARPPPSATESHAALERLAAAAVDTAHPGLARPAARLAAGLEPLLARTDRAALLQELHAVLAAPLADRIESLREAMQAGPVTPTALRADPELAAQRIATDGRLRIEVYPAENLNDGDALERFVREVQSVDPDAFGEAVVIYESGRIVVTSFRRALLFAAAAILLLLALLWRSHADVIRLSLSIGFAALLTAACSAVAGPDFNFANIIVLPLLIGMGVDSGVHLMHRRRCEDGGAPLLQTGTARAVILSALTTLASFGTLAFVSHPGMASLGRLLVSGIALMLLSSLVLLPCLADRARHP